MSEHRYRRKPTEADAICWNGQNLGSVQAFASGALGIGTVEGGALPLWVAKSSAVCRVEHGDWIIREPDGSGFYPCAADVFAATYEPAGTPETALEAPAPDDKGRDLAAAHVSARARRGAVPGKGSDGSEEGCGIALIRAERLRQVAVEGYSAAHDAEHAGGELSLAAAAYALAAAGGPSAFAAAEDEWPFRPASFKPGPEPLDSLVKAGALIAAEIDRILAEGARRG